VFFLPFLSFPKFLQTSAFEAFSAHTHLQTSPRSGPSWLPDTKTSCSLSHHRYGPHLPVHMRSAFRAHAVHRALPLQLRSSSPTVTSATCLVLRREQATKLSRIRHGGSHQSRDLHSEAVNASTATPASHIAHQHEPTVAAITTPPRHRVTLAEIRERRAKAGRLIAGTAAASDADMFKGPVS